MNWLDEALELQPGWQRSDAVDWGNTPGSVLADAAPTTARDVFVDASTVEALPVEPATWLASWGSALGDVGFSEVDGFDPITVTESELAEPLIGLIDVDDPIAPWTISATDNDLRPDPFEFEVDDITGITDGADPISVGTAPAVDPVDAGGIDVPDDAGSAQSGSADAEDVIDAITNGDGVDSDLDVGVDIAHSVAGDSEYHPDVASDEHEDLDDFDQQTDVIGE